MGKRVLFTYYLFPQRSNCLSAVTKPLLMCFPFPDQRVASFCTLTDMQHGQDLEDGQELPLCVDPGSGKDFMDTAGYVSSHRSSHIL